MGVELLPPLNTTYRPTESSACHYSTTDITGLLMSPYTEFFAATAASAFALQSFFNPESLLLIQAGNEMFVQSQEHGLLNSFG